MIDNVIDYALKNNLEITFIPDIKSEMEERLPAIWTRNVPLYTAINALMHLHFNGTFDATIDLSTTVLASVNQKSKFARAANLLGVDFVKAYNVLTNKSITGAYQSENYVCLARLSPFLFSMFEWPDDAFTSSNKLGLNYGSAILKCIFAAVSVISLVMQSTMINQLIIDTLRTLIPKYLRTVDILGNESGTAS